MRLLTAKELAARWQVSEKLVFKLAAQGEIPAVRLGRRVRFDPEAIRLYETNTWTKASSAPGPGV
jgi:excisionase family DNA binding protein